MNNLLNIKPLRLLLTSRFFPLIPQVFILICFAAIIYGGLIAPDVDAKLAGTLRNTNLAALLVWSLWWPLVIISAVLFGRIWCQVCPMELVNSLVSKIGLKRKVPSFFKSGWVVTLFYAFALLGFIRTFWAHRYPRRMAYFFIFLFGSAVLFALIYEKRAFCNHVCPVGHLLGLYALCSPFEWRAKDKDICAQCKTKECIDPKKYYSLVNRSCTSNLYPAAIQDNRRCLLCTQCLKVCPHGNLRFSLRKPLADFFKSIEINSAEFFLLFFASGLVIWEISEEWDASKKALLFVPDNISRVLGASGEIANFIHAVILFVLLPAIIFLIPALLARLTAGFSLFEAAKKFSLIFLPTIAFTHLLKALFKISSRIPYYSLSVKDPIGYSTAKLIASGGIHLNKSFTNFMFPFLSYIALIVFGGVLISSWLILFKSDAFKNFSIRQKLPFMLIVTVYCAVFIITTIFARF